MPTSNVGYVSHRSGWDNQWSRDRHNWVCSAEHEWTICCLFELLELQHWHCWFQRIGCQSLVLLQPHYPYHSVRLRPNMQNDLLHGFAVHCRQSRWSSDRSPQVNIDIRANQRGCMLQHTRRIDGYHDYLKLVSKLTTRLQDVCNAYLP